MVDAQPTVDNLRNGILQWAAERVGVGRPLNLFLVDHGTVNRFYLDKPGRQWIAPQELDEWLSQVESAKPGLISNVFIEMCHAGSFIEEPQSISKAGRLVVTSTNVHNVAYASQQGAAFSDQLISALGQGSSVLSSFQSARVATQSAYPVQEPWLDADGDGVPNELDDAVIAAQRGFGYAGSLPDDLWPPYIVQVSLPVHLQQINQSTADGTKLNSTELDTIELNATVLDDVRVERVWAVIYPPSYTPPTESEDLVLEDTLATILLQSRGNNQYAAQYPDFEETGTYLIVVHAEDEDGMAARPVALEVQNGSLLYLPVMRE
ncbi:MAG: C13 family peptidase [Chloroflexota bacterium]